MKILLTHRYFWPDAAPYGLMLKAIADRLAADGHRVEVFSTIPSYRPAAAPPPAPEPQGPICITRLAMPADRGSPASRLINARRYSRALAAQIRACRPDLVTASTAPPILAARAALHAARAIGAKFLYHVQDIHPDISALTGGLPGRWPLKQMLAAVDRATLDAADVVVTLSGDMADTLASRAPSLRAMPSRLHVIDNFGLDGGHAGSEVPAAFAKPPDSFRAIFAGNLGRFQNLPLLAEGIATLFPRYPQLQLAFMGEGAMRGRLRAAWGSHPQVRFLPHLPFAEAAPVIASADIGLVALRPGLYRAASPSKVSSNAALGLPMLILVEPESCLAREAVSQGFGLVVRGITAAAVADALEPALRDPGLMASMRRRTADWHASRSRDMVLDRWSGLVGALAKGGGLRSAAQAGWSEAPATVKAAGR